MANVTLTYECYNYYNQSSSVRSDYEMSVYEGGTIADTKKYAPSVSGWTLKSCDPPSIDSVAAGDVVEAYYYKSVNITLKYYKDNSIVSSDTTTVSAYVGADFTLTHSNYKNSYSGYEFEYAEIDGDEYTSTSDKYEVENSSSITVKYYYTKISGSDATLKIKYLEKGTNKSIATQYTKSGCSWNSTTWLNKVDLSSSTYKKTISGYTYWGEN
jgi:hypothetical protein